MKRCKDRVVITRGFLYEWTIIIENISYLIAKSHNLNEVDDAGKTLDEFIGNMRDMFEHLIDANKLFIEFGRA